jgi:hypothetical protein
MSLIPAAVSVAWFLRADTIGRAPSPFGHHGRSDAGGTGREARHSANYDRSPEAAGRRRDGSDILRQTRDATDGERGPIGEIPRQAPPIGGALYLPNIQPVIDASICPKGYP